MSEEFDQIGTVRRRPRAGHQRTGASRSREAADGDTAETEARRRNGHSRARRDEEDRAGWGRRAPGPEPRSKRTRQDESRRRQELPFNEVDLDEEPGFRLPFDPFRLIRAAKRNSIWIMLAAALAGVFGFFVAARFVDYKISLPLMRKTTNAMRNEGVQSIDKFMVREFSDQTIYSFMRSGEVMKNVSEKARTIPILAGLSVTPEKLAGAVQVKPSDNPDFVILTMEAFGGLPAMVELLNLYAKEVVAYTKTVQRSEASVISQFLQDQIVKADQEIEKLTGELREFSDTGLGDFERENELEIKRLIALQEKLSEKKFERESLDAKIKTRTEQLKSQAPGGTSAVQQAKAELQEMLIRMREEHPLVIAKRREIAALEARGNDTNAAPVIRVQNTAMVSNPLYLQVLDLEAQKPTLDVEIRETQNQIDRLEKKLGDGTTNDVRYTLKKAALQSQRAARDDLQKRQRDSELFTANALGYFEVMNPATLSNVNHKGRWFKVGFLALVAGMMGLLATVFLVMLTEALDTSLKTEEDIARVTGLPVLATLGDLQAMSASAQVNWAFRTLTVLKGKLSKNSDQALVCGIISANHGEGRSTWVNLLTSAASQRGLRVLTVDTRPTAAAPAGGDSRQEAPKTENDSHAHSEGNGTAKKETIKGSAPIHLPDHEDKKQAELSPAAVVQQFAEPNNQSLVHIPLPGWVWSLERRKQWQDALEQWREVDNLVIFVELPPASESEAILLAENMPQLIWLVGSGMADAAETKEHLETIQHARCNLVGTVLNHAPPPVFNTRLARWFKRVAPVVALLGTLSFAHAQPAETRPAGAQAANEELQPAAIQGDERFAFSANARRKRAAWQERLTFGPGDAMDIHVFEKPQMSRTNVVVGPDGRISFLQANNVPVSGLSVTEVRERLDNELARFYTEAAAPRTIVIPVAFTSKKYFMLGMVNAKGAYVLDRPLTLLEAVARAKGLETGLYQRTTVEMADLGRSFLVRNGEKLPVDFERLFQEGDLRQNILMEPGDYVYFASTSVNDIYVMGEVMSPGPIGFVPNATALTAIIDRGGFSERAFKKRVLVVRGSLEEPETFVIDVGSTLRAQNEDFRLRPRDIVYVSARPWIRAEELLDEAASSFIQGAVTTWSGVNVGPIVTKRLLPRTRPQ